METVPSRQLFSSRLGVRFAKRVGQRADPPLIHWPDFFNKCQLSPFLIKCNLLLESLFWSCWSGDGTVQSCFLKAHAAISLVQLLDTWITTKHCSQRCAIYGSKPLCRWVINIFVSSAGQNALSQNIFDKERRSECSCMGRRLRSKGSRWICLTVFYARIGAKNFLKWMEAKRYWHLEISSESKRAKFKELAKNKNGWSCVLKMIVGSNGVRRQVLLILGVVTECACDGWVAWQ